MPVFSLHFIETFDFLLDYPFTSWVNRLSGARIRKEDLSFPSPFLYLPSPLLILRLRSGQAKEGNWGTEGEVSE